MTKRRDPNWRQLESLTGSDVMDIAALQICKAISDLAASIPDSSATYLTARATAIDILLDAMIRVARPEEPPEEVKADARRALGDMISPEDVALAAGLQDALCRNQAELGGISVSCRKPRDHQGAHDTRTLLEIEQDMGGIGWQWTSEGIQLFGVLDTAELMKLAEVDGLFDELRQAAEAAAGAAGAGFDDEVSDTVRGDRCGAALDAGWVKQDGTVSFDYDEIPQGAERRLDLCQLVEGHDGLHRAATDEGLAHFGDDQAIGGRGENKCGDQLQREGGEILTCARVAGHDQLQPEAFPLPHQLGDVYWFRPRPGGDALIWEGKPPTDDELDRAALPAQCGQLHSNGILTCALPEGHRGDHRREKVTWQRGLAETDAPVAEIEISDCPICTDPRPHVAGTSCSPDRLR